MSALVRPRGFASPRRSARFSSAWRVKGREEEASLGEPAARRSKAGGSAYLVVLHLPVVYVQLQADGGSHIRGNRKHGAARGGAERTSMESSSTSSTFTCTTHSWRHLQEVRQKAGVVGRRGHSLLVAVTSAGESTRHEVWIRLQWEGGGTEKENK